MITLLLLLLPVGPQPIRVERVEWNHVHAANGEHVFDQLILRRWQRLATGDSHYVTDWRTITEANRLRIRPLDDLTLITWTHEGKDYAVLTLRARETWTQHDPEVRDRRKLKPDDRRSYLK